MPKTKKVKVPDFDKGYRMGYNKGQKQGNLEGYEFHSVLMLYAMKDKLKIPDADISVIHDTIDKYVKMVKDGYIDYQSIKSSLTKNFGWSFTWEDEADGI